MQSPLCREEFAGRQTACELVGIKDSGPGSERWRMERKTIASSLRRGGGESGGGRIKAGNLFSLHNGLGDGTGLVTELEDPHGREAGRLPSTAVAKGCAKGSTGKVLTVKPAQYAGTNSPITIQSIEFGKVLRSKDASQQMKAGTANGEGCACHAS